MNGRFLILAGACSAVSLLPGCGTSNSARTVETVTVTKTDAAGASTTTLPRAQTTAPTTSVPAAKTRTATAPSFTGGAASGGGGGLSSAVSKLRALGFSPLGTSSYHATQTLRVLIGARPPAGSASAGAQQAFFFSGSNYLGTDASGTSAKIRVSEQSDTSITLSYGIYKHSDPPCCSTGGTRKVHFQLDMGRLMAVDAIPSPAQRR